MNSAFRALWLVNSEVISKYYSPPSNRRVRFLTIRPLVTHKITFWSANYSACVVYTKTIIHLSVGERDGYLPPLRWITVKYHGGTTGECHNDVGWLVYSSHILAEFLIWGLLPTGWNLEEERNITQQISLRKHRAHGTECNVPVNSWVFFSSSTNILCSLLAYKP